jgi:hypothetical protein
MDNPSEALFALKPVTFRYKKEIDRNGLPQFELIAEDVADVNPQLVVRDKEGKVNTVRYEQINAMLLNEFLKEHKKVEEQQVTITDLKKDLGVLTAQLKEQAPQIQKVSAQLEMRRPLTRVLAAIRRRFVSVKNVAGATTPATVCTSGSLFDASIYQCFSASRMGCG